MDIFENFSNRKVGLESIILSNSMIYLNKVIDKSAVSGCCSNPTIANGLLITVSLSRIIEVEVMAKN
jgi:hypothetical protein